MEMLKRSVGHAEELEGDFEDSKKSRSKSTINYKLTSFVTITVCLILLYVVFDQQQLIQAYKEKESQFLHAERSLEISQHAMDIMTERHTEALDLANAQMSACATKIQEDQQTLQSMNETLTRLNCRAGYSPTTAPSEESTTSTAFRLFVPDTKISDMVMMGSRDSIAGVEHILGQHKIDQYHIAKLDLQDGDVVIDVGSHIGCFALAVAKLFPHVKVIAVEPLPANFYFLQANLAYHGLSNVIAINRGVSSHGFPMQFWLNDGNTGGSSAFQQTPQEFCVQTVTIERLIDKYVGKNAVLKVLNMDCEGCEFDVLPTLPLDRIQTLQVEFHDHLYRHFPADIKNKVEGSRTVADQKGGWW
eukprot:c3369_g1_i1.p1 GENE.c3369_g1_i1~~c3369_g1_i1.p1  ORF type:complete len:360 (+),score=49.26 c3369_g1_i1:44-1123(+)